jgi:hypothetical protein
MLKINSFKMTTKKYILYYLFPYLLFLGLINQVHAANHALILTIGTYSDPNANLPGIDLDAQNAALIAKTMGVPEANIQFLKDSSLTLAGFQKAFSDLGQKVKTGDNVFVYYSGHGTQMQAGAGQCLEGMVTFDMKTFRDTEIQKYLTELSQKAARVIMMNDSCFSGGQAQSKSTRSLNGKTIVAKSFKFSQAPSGYVCGEAINMKMSRSVAPRAKTAGANFLYIAASQDKEVSYASPTGSFGTLGWRKCLTGSTDADRSGSLSGEEIKACTQRYITEASVNQNIALVGNKDLPLVFVAETPTIAETAPNQDNTPAPDMTAAPPTPEELDTNAPIPNPQGSYAGANTLNDIRNAASPSVIVQLKPTSDKLKIGKDILNFSVTTNKDGHLTILQVGSDGQTFMQLFPNERDNNAYVKAGVTVLPRPNWQIKSGGPAGTSYLLAILSDSPRDFTKGMKALGPFKTSAGKKAAKNLIIEATETATQAPPKPYGASDVVSIQEF